MSAKGLGLAENLLFDLDGTLLDSLPGIQYSAAEAFRACAIPMGKAEMRTLIGPPIDIILGQMAARKLTADELDALVRAFRWSYDCEGWRMTPHYVGAAAMLARLAEQNRRLFVVSNKPRHISVRILEAEGTLGYFTEVATRDSRVPPYENKLEMMQGVIERWRLEPEDCLMVGDTMEDAEAASHTGMRFCLMTHGYGVVPLESSVPVALRLDSFAHVLEELSID
jgi:phosphoglycolate phosphatase